MVKLINLALHRLYDRAQTMSEVNLKSQFFKVTKETELGRGRDEDNGIEMKVMRASGGGVGGGVGGVAGAGGGGGSRLSVEQAINEASEENSIMSIDNVNSIIGECIFSSRSSASTSLANLPFFFRLLQISRLMCIARIVRNRLS